MAVLLIAPILAAALLTSLSCAVRKPAVEILVRENCPTRTLTLLEENTGVLQTIKGTLQVRLSMEEPGYGGRVQAGLAAQRPDRARLKVYAGFSNLIDVAVDGDSLWAFLPSRSLLLTGSVEDGATPLEAGPFLVALREALFPREFCSGECSSVREERGTCRIEENFAGGQRLSFVEAKSGRLRGMHLVNAEGEEWVEITYKNYRRSGKISFPRDIEISFPLAKLQMTLLFDRVKLNSPIAEGSFRLDVPSGTTVRGFDDLPGNEGEEIGQVEGPFED